MQITHKRQLNERVQGFFLLSHPGPVLMRILAVTVFTVLAAWPHFAWPIIALVVGTYAAMQVSIAMLNDYCDRGLDVQGKPGKPIPRGLVSPREALIGSLCMILLMLVLLIPLSPLALLCSLCYLALGQAYNFVGTRFIAPARFIVSALAMPFIPLYAFVCMGRIFPSLFWLVPVGFLLGVTLNLANALQDVEKDAANGASTLAVVLGVNRSFIACQFLIVLSATLIGVLKITKFVPAQSWILITTLILTCLSIEAMLLFFGPEKPVETRRFYFYLVAFTCVLLVGGWLVAALV